MFRKNQYHENGHTAQSNFEIQCHLHQATIIDLLHRIGKKNNLILYKSKKEPSKPRQFQAKKNLEASLYLTSYYTTKQHGTGNKTDI